MSTVTRRAVGFKFGTYPAKRFECSRDQFVAANGASGTVPVGLCPRTRDHYVGEANDLDGITGTANFAVDEAGDLLPLSLDLPEWVSGLVDSKGYKLSAVFDGPESRKLLKFDFVENPAVPEAVVFSDGTAHESEVSVGFAMPGEADHLQRHHDFLAASMGGLCCDPGYQPARRSPGDKAAAAMHDYFVRQGAKCAPPHPSAKGPTAMSATETETTDREAPPVTLSADDLALLREAKGWKAKADEQEARLAKLTSERLTEKAVVFSDGYIRGEAPKLTPACRDDLFLLARALGRLDHEAAGPVTFSDRNGAEVQGTYLGRLEKLLGNLPTLDLKREKVAGTVVLSEQPGGEDDAKAAKDREDRKKRNQAL